MAESGPVKLLSLDGGGVRGLSSLLILQNLMHRISPLEELRPCEVFDMIGGTSTGGIIAIMLGRLRMKVSDCIDAYHFLSAVIFEEPWRPKAWKMSKALFGLTGSTDDARSKRLRAVVCKIIEKYLPEDEKIQWSKQGEQFDAGKVPLKAASGTFLRDCLTFVVTAQKADGQRVCLRSYSHPTEVDCDFGIVEACLATSAAPLIFAPLPKNRNGMVEMFVDGGLGYNNPINLVLFDAREVFPDRKIQAIVSVGTGVKQASQVENKLLPLAKKVAEMATDATQEAEKFSRSILSTDKDLYDSYFRFDTSGEMSNIPLQEWRMLAVISQRTRAWLSASEYTRKAAKCAKILTPKSMKDHSEHQIQVQKDSVESASDEALPGLRVRLAHDQADWTNQISITDPVDGSKLQITLWRTVRIPEDGKLYDLPAGLGKFPLLDAAQIKDRQAQDSNQDVNCVFPMYDREAMYMEFKAGKYDYGPGYIQRPYAIRPYAGGINAISGVSIHAKSSAIPSSNSNPTAPTRVGTLQLNEVVGAPPLAEQDYVVADISTSNISVKPQWLDGVVESQGRVKQFVAVPFGSGESIEAQKVGNDNVGGLQLEIIPSLPLHRLRHHQGRQITIYTKAFYIPNSPPVHVDAGALVWDFMYSYSVLQEVDITGFRCLFDNRALEPLYPLSHYPITHHSTVYIVYKLRGGGSTGPTNKRMALGVGGSISQNISRDIQPPWIWDISRAIRINIQIINSLAFEDLTGLVAPPTPISFNTYKALGIPFFQYYMEDAQDVSGDFGGMLSVGSFHSDPGTETATGLEKGEQSWTATPDQCAKCRQCPPFRLLRPCSHPICQPCYRSITAEMATVEGRPQLTSQCPVAGCGEKIERAVAWPSTSDRVPLEALYGETRLPIRTDPEAGRAFDGAKKNGDVRNRSGFQC